MRNVIFTKNDYDSFDSTDSPMNVKPSERSN